MEKLINRQKQIILYLMQRGRSTCASISSSLNVSAKTIRNDIKDINAAAHMPLIISDIYGYSLNSNNISLVMSLVDQKDADTESDSRLLRHILLGDEPTSFAEIAEYFNISEWALQARVKTLNEFVRTFDLEIVRRKGLLILKGTEYNRRRLYLSLIHNETDTSFLSLTDYTDYFPNVDIDLTIKVVRECVQDQGYVIPSFYENNLMINVLTILSLNSNDVEVTPSQELTKEGIIAHRIVDKLNIMKHRSYATNMITSALTGIIHTNTQNAVEKPSYSIEFESELRRIVKSAFDYYSITADLDSFMPLFAMHVHELIHRLQNGNVCIFTENLSIKNTSYYVYDVAVYICNSIDQYFHIQIPDSEISLIAVHIGFAIEASFSRQNRINLYLYTGGYPLINQYIQQKLVEDFENEIELIPIADLHSIFSYNDVDLLITTKSIKLNNELVQFEVCKITQLLTDRDKAKIKRALFDAVDRQNQKEFSTLARLCFDKDLFFIDNGYKDREHALSFLVLKLQLAGVVDDTFLESVKKRENLDDTSFMNTYAIPHAFESKALKFKIAVLINPEGISWGKQNVKFVFLIAITKNDTAELKPLYDGFADFLGDDQRLTALEGVQSFDDFIRIITQ